jgi:hypothetical protein
MERIRSSAPTIAAVMRARRSERRIGQLFALAMAIVFASIALMQAISLPT